MRKLTLLLTAMVIALACHAGSNRFLNPVIPADFPDPDVTKLGDTYYFLSTTMHLMPGATVLKSNDLVNWEYCCNPLEHMSDADKYNLINGQYSYSQGMWAGAIEAHDGKLYILLNCNDAGAYVLSTDDPEGKWESKRLARSYYDPGMIIEGDRIYIVCGINEIHICELDLDWNLLKDKTVIRQDGTGLEGSHLYHIGDYYYIYSTYGGWPTGQTIFRSKDIFGSYEEKLLMEKWINGAANTVHQGALMETNTGEWWTMLMQDLGAIGRLPSLHPVIWGEDGWPTIADNGIPQPYYDMPNVGQTYPETTLPTDDNFRTWQLGKQWQWNHNPPTGYWSLLDNPGNLRLYTSSVTDDFMTARGSLTQRIFAKHNTSAPYGLESKPSIATIAINVANMKPGDVAGLAIQQDPYAMIGVTLDDDGNYNLLWKTGSHTNTDNFTPSERTVKLSSLNNSDKRTVYLRGKFNAVTSEVTFQYSYDNNTWRNASSTTKLRYNLSVFVGARWALFNYATKALGGHVDFDWFTTQDEPDIDALEPEGFEGYGEEILTVESLTIAGGKDEIELLVGNPHSINLTATFANGRTEDVSARATFTAEWPELLDISDGRITGLKEGKTTIEASYTDPLGNVKKASFDVSASFFPFSDEYIKNIWDTNTYYPDIRGFQTATYGQIGWEYSTPVDMSKYKFLVLKLDEQQTCNADIRIYTNSSIWGSCFIQKIGDSKEVVIDLQSIKYTDGDDKGKAVNIASIYKVCFWSNGASVIDVNDMYLTNRRDHARETGNETPEDLYEIILKSGKGDTANNPLNPYNFCADPTALEYDGRVYVYGTNDHQQFGVAGYNESNSYGYINSLVCMSSEDLVNWTWHGTIDVKSIAPWTGCSWAPTACAKTDKDGNTHFYIYFANGASGIGVLTADSPTGPWRDPLGKALIRPGQPGMGEVVWLFDPGVVVDENGDGWLAWGGGDRANSVGNKLLDGNTRIAKLGDDMISIASDMIVLPAPFHFEANELNYIGGKYVLTYCSNWDGDRSLWDEFEYYDHDKTKPAAPGSAQMCYMTSTDPLNPESWQYQGAYLDHPGGNNHTHLQKFGSAYYLFYHSESLSRALNGDGKGYRSIGVDKISVDEANCVIPKISMTSEGVTQLRGGRPELTEQHEAEMLWNGAGISGAVIGDRICIVPEQTGAWTAVKGTFTKNEVLSFKATLRGKGWLEVRVGNLYSESVAAVKFDSSDFEDYIVRVNAPFKGPNTIYFVFSNVGNDDVAFDKWQFFETDESSIVSPETDASIVKIEYYNLSGMRISNPDKGLYIRRTTLSDGTVRTQKVMRK